MTITVNAPGGASVNFPDGTDAATIQGVMSQHFGAPKQASPSMASGLGRAFSEGVPILGGLLNKADAATDAALAPLMNPLFDEKEQLKGDFGQRYKQAIATQEGEDTAFATEHPIASTAANIAGGIASTGGAAMTGTGARLLGLTAKSLPGMIGQGAASGAAIGAADTAIRGGNPIVGGVVGGVAGAAGPLIGKGVGAVADKFLRTAKAAITPEQEAAQKIAEAFQKDKAFTPDTKGLSTQELDAAATRGQPVALMDAGGRATQRLAKTSANFSPEAQETIDRTLGSRYRTQNTRTADFVKSTFNYPDRFAQQEAIDAVEKTVNRANYAKAHANPASKAMWDEGFEQLMQAPIMQQAAKSATSTGANRSALKGFTPVQRPFEFHDTDSLTPRYTQRVDDQGRRILPNLEFWDNVKRNLGDKEDALLRGGEKSVAADVRNLRTELVRHLDDLVPEYANARGGAAQFFGAEDALEAGKNAALDAKMDNREIRRGMDKFSLAERKLFQDGFVDQFIKALQDTKDRTNILDQINATPNARERFMMVVGPQRSKEVETFLRVEELMQRANRSVTGNSTTAQQTGDMKLGAMDFFDIKGAMVKLLRGAASAAGRGIDERVAVKVAEMLTSKNEQEFSRAIKMIAKNKTLLGAIRNPDAAIGAVGTRGLSIGYGAGPNPQRPN